MINVLLFHDIYTYENNGNLQHKMIR